MTDLSKQRQSSFLNDSERRFDLETSKPACSVNRRFDCDLWYGFVVPAVSVGLAGSGHSSSDVVLAVSGIVAGAVWLSTKSEAAVCCGAGDLERVWFSVC